MEVSVLICTYNRPEKLLHTVLHSIIHDSEEKPDELIVVNGGDERADRVVRQYVGQGVCVKLINTINKNLAASRNIGLAHCTKDIIAMTDDDARVFPDWIAKLKQVHREQPDVGAVGGPVIGIDEEMMLGKVAEMITFPKWENPRFVLSLPGVNISYKKTIIDQIGLQDETLFRGEDVDFNWRIKELGYEILFDPRIKVNHYHRSTFSSFLNQYYMYGRGQYLLRRKWWAKRRVYPRKLISGNILYIAFSFVTGPFVKAFSICRRLDSFAHCLRSLPLIFAADLVFRVGVLVQAAKEWNLNISERLK